MLEQNISKTSCTPQIHFALRRLTIVATIGEPDVTFTILVAPFSDPCAASISFGMSKLVNRKCPMWLVAKCNSIPSSLRVRSGNAKIAALFTMISTVGTSDHERTLAAASRTDCWLERSTWRER